MKTLIQLAGLVKEVIREATPIPMTPVDPNVVLTNLRSAFTIVATISWIVIIVGYYIGALQVALPIPSRTIKQSGKYQMENSAIVALLLAISTSVIAMIFWIIGLPVPSEGKRRSNNA